MGHCKAIRREWSFVCQKLEFGLVMGKRSVFGMTDGVVVKPLVLSSLYPLSFQNQKRARGCGLESQIRRTWRWRLSSISA